MMSATKPPCPESAHAVEPVDPAAFYQENGYHLAKGVFTRAEMREYERDFDRIVAQLLASNQDINARWEGDEAKRLGNAGTVIVHTHQVQLYSAAWLRLFMDARFLDMTARFLGPDIILHHSKLFQKPPEIGAPFPAHQDWMYFPSRTDNMLAAVVFLTDATDEMGCLRVFPGSHKLGRIPDSMGGSREFARRFPLEQGVPVEVEAGDVVFFHYCTVHGSMTNRSSQTRKSVLVQMYDGQNEIEAGNHHLDSRLVLRGWNHRMTRACAGR